MKSTTTTGIIRSFPSFDYFLEKAKHRISQFSQKRQDELNINRLSLFNYWGAFWGYSIIFAALLRMPCAKLILIVKQINFCY